uniref:Bm7965 n=1 Tax=Brugia malayi TaxID=6279 RepID=A0A1I9G8B1_BRUMA|nr:Bm7965 [Brugia malayi]
MSASIAISANFMKGENLEQTSIELTIEEKLPLWVLDEVYKRKELDPDWSVGKFDNA